MKKFMKMDNVALFTLFEIFRDPLFWGPIIISYIINVGGMTLSELYFMEAVILVLMVITEIYSSAWADLLGRKKILIIGAGLNIVSIIILAIANCPLHIWVSNTMIMIGFSLISGTNEALIADSLKEEGKYEQYLVIISKVRSKRHFIVAFTSVISGYLYAINPRLPMFLSIPGVIFAFFVILFIKESKRRDRATQKENFQLIKLSFIFLANNKKLKWIIGFFVLLAVVSKIWFFTYNPYFELVNLSPEYYGWIFAILNLNAWYIIKNAHNIKEKIGEFGILLTSVLSMSVPLILMGLFVSKISLSFLIFGSFLRGITQTVSSEMKNRYLSSENRATVLSLGSSLNSTIAAISLFIFGLVLKSFSMQNSMIGLGIIVLILGLYSLKKYKKIFS